MSILPPIGSTSTAPASAATQPAAPIAPVTPRAEISISEWTIWLIWAAACISIAKFAGVFRRGSVAGPARLQANDSGFEMICVFAVAYLINGGVMAYFVLHLHLQPPLNVLIGNITGTVVSFIAILVLLNRIATFGIGTLRLNFRHLPMGLALGLLTIFILFPLISVTSGLVTVIVNHLHLKPPDAHAVLQMLENSDSRWVTVLSVLLAVVVAPIYEETLFRGLLQTALSQFFLTIAMHWARLNTGPEILRRTGSDGEAPGPSEYLGTGVDGKPISLQRHFISRWLAIVIASALFAAVHIQPAFLAPLFVLAIGLGYVFERTGNLWVSITTHALFNATQISLFLYSRHPHG